MIKLMLELFVPLIFSNVLHMFVVKYNVFSFLAKPISKKFFGQNKTYRGFIFVSMSNSFFHVLFNTFILKNTQSIDLLILYGALFGFLYCLFELPNSFFKRRMGIKPGEAPKKHKSLFTFIDKSDSTLGLSIIFCVLKGQNFSVFLFIYLCALLTHLSLSFLLYRFKIKASL